MPKVITLYLTDEEAKEIERLCEEKGIARYTLIKTAIRQLCADLVSNPHPSHKSNNPSVFAEYLKRAKYVCESCRFPLVKVEGLKACPMCGHTRYEEI